MRNAVKILVLSVALAACNKKGGDEALANSDQDLTASSIAGNDVTAIDAVTGADANMAADVDYIDANASISSDGDSNAVAPTKTATKPKKSVASKPAAQATAPAAAAPEPTATSNSN